MKELLEFLLQKCQNGLNEAADNVDSQLKDELKEIGKALNSRKGKILSCSSPGETKNELYDLISMVTDFTISNKHPAQILCVPLQIRSRFQTRKNLRDIRTHVEDLGVSKLTTDKSGPSETVSRRRICKILPWLIRSLGQGPKKNSSNQNGGSAEPAGEGTQETSSSSGRKEVSYKLEGLPEEAKNIIGFNDLRKEIETRLDFKNRRGHVEIGILGMCGSGKTTLARLIYSHSSDFEPRIWVGLPHIPASKQRDDKQILRFILNQCGDGVYQSAMDEYEKPQLLRTIRKNLLGKRYLLVLDGLWDADIKWYFELSRALDWQYKYGDFGYDGSESAVILTSRLDDVAKTMVGISGLHQIHPLLNEETCWDIFINQVKSRGSNIPLENYTDELKEEIKEQCDGLPLAALTLAEIIPTQPPSPPPSPPPPPPPPPPPQVISFQLQLSYEYTGLLTSYPSFVYCHVIAICSCLFLSLLELGGGNFIFSITPYFF